MMRWKGSTGDTARSVTASGWIPGAVLLFTLCVPAARAAAPDTPVAAREAEIVGTLLKSLSDEPSPLRDRVIGKLMARGHPVVPALLAAGRKYREEVHVEAIVSVLRGVDETSLEPYLLAFIAEPADVPAASAALRHLRQAGGREAIAAVISGMSDNPPRLKRVAERTLVSLLVRHDDHRTWDRVDSILSGAPEETRARVIGSIGETGAKLGLELLVRLIGRWPALDHAVVAAISQMPEAGIAERVVPRLRRMLHHPDVNVRRETVTALAVFGGAESAQTLIELLEDEHRGMRENSLWALQTIAGLEFPATKSRWQLWCDNEVDWWESEGQGLLDVLSSGRDLQIIEATRWLAGHRLYRNRFSPLLRNLLEHPSHEVRTAAETAMERLGLDPGREEVERAPLAGRAGPTGAYGVPEGFHPISRAAYLNAREAPPPPEETPASLTRVGWLLPVLGLCVIGMLLLRIFGPGVIYRLVSFWNSGERRHGPVVMVVERPVRRAGSEETETETESEPKPEPVPEPESEDTPGRPDPSLNLGSYISTRRLRSNRSALGEKPVH
jgi:HEAT repeat protein